MRAKRMIKKDAAEKIDWFHCEKTQKVDTSVNNPDMYNLIERHNEYEKNLVPMRINARTIIYVTADNFNEEYKQRWISKHEGECRNKVNASKKLSCGRKKEFDKEMAIEMLSEAYSVKDISKEIGISHSVLYNFFKEEDIHIPNAKERIKILHKKGFKLDEIIYRTNLKRDVVMRHYRHL